MTREATEAQTIFQGRYHDAIYRSYGTDTLIVAFSERKEPAPAEFFGKRFFEKEKISYIAARTLDNSWYLREEMSDLISRIKVTIEAEAAKNVILFGASMGSFGCVRAANEILPQRIILCGPVVSLDPKIERRWSSDYDRLMNNYWAISNRILPFQKAFEVYAVYDPNCEDRCHVEFLSQSCDVNRVKVPDSGHMVLQFLRDSGALSDIMRTLVRNHVETKKIDNILYQSRKKNKMYLLNLAERFDRKPWRQARILNFALQAFPEAQDVLLAYAAFNARQKELIGAAEIIREVVKRHGQRSLGVPLGKAIANFVANGGETDEISDAISLFESAQPRSRGTQLWYSRFLRFAKRYNKAFQAHEKFMGGDTFQAHAHIERGLILEEMGLFHAACREFCLAVEMAPQFAPAKHHRDRAERRYRQSLISE